MLNAPNDRRRLRCGDVLHDRSIHYVVKTGARAEGLKSVLVAAGMQPTTQVAPVIEPELLEQALSLYHALGGVQAAPKFRPGSWDLAFDDGLVVDLDEELHFNRYRTVTLAPAWSAALPWAKEYRAYCDVHEDDCLSAGKWGRRWTNPSCEAMFGPASPPGEFAGNGAPRWKQRALYDAIKDLSAISGVALARVSVHDVVAGSRLGDVLAGNATVHPEAVKQLVASRRST